MGNLLHTEWYRFWKYPVFRHLGIAVCFFSALFPICLDPNPNRPIYGFIAVGNLLALYPALFCLFVMPVLIYTICSPFRNRTFWHERLSGYSTGSMLGSRLMVGVGITTLISLASIILSVGFFTVRNGWYEAGMSPLPDTKGITEYFIGFLFLAIDIAQAAAICILFACITKEPASALILSWFVYLFGFWMNYVCISDMDISFDSLYKLYILLPGWQLQAIRVIQEETLFLISYLPYGLIAGILELIPLYILAHVSMKVR